jgi:hypothetical protein
MMPHSMEYTQLMNGITFERVQDISRSESNSHPFFGHSVVALEI